MSITNKHFDVAIIGAGLTGLTTAYYLKKAGVNFIVLEQQSRIGGVIHSEHHDGFTYETGPNTGVLSSPEAAELIEALSHSCQLEIANAQAKKRLIWKGKRWVALPSGLLSGVITPLFSFADKLRILGEPFRKPGTNPHETLAELVLRRMGKSFLDYAIDPFILGIYAGDPSYLVPKYALPKLYNLEQSYGSFIGGAIKKAKEPKSDRDKKATKEVFSIKNGLSNLINALGKEVGNENIALNCKDLKVDFEGKYTLSTPDGSVNITSSKVITTIGSYALPETFTFLSDWQKSVIDNLLYARVAQLSLGFKKWEGHSINAFGGLVPSKEKRKVLGVLFPSSFLTNRAPEGGALLSVFTGGFRNPEITALTDEELFNALIPDLKDMLGLNEVKPDLIRVFRYTHAIPQYGASTGDRLEMVNQLQNQYPGLYIAGNLRDGIGMSDRIKQGTQIANDVIEAIKG